MRIISWVRSRHGNYPIWMGSRGLRAIGTAVRRAGVGKTIALVTDRNVRRLYGRQVSRSLSAAGFRTVCLTIPTGESHKTLDQVRHLYGRMLRGGLDRDSAVIALGGGVVGDLAGFVAATYMRGIGLVQVPTTLLAQVDSAIGGKTGVDLPEGKNLVGAFYPPRLVWADIATLQDLPRREFQAGLGEVVKYGLIGPGGFWKRLTRQAPDILARRIQPLTEAIAACARIKADIVSGDERESGPRRHLNLGHTFAHAIETATGYRRYRHGEAVAIGLCMAVDLSIRLGHCPAALLPELKALLKRLGLPTRARSIRPSVILAALAYDKKKKGNRNRFVLIRRPGQVFVTDRVPPVLVRQVIKEYVHS